MMQNIQELPSFRSRLDQEFDVHRGRLPKHKIFISHSGKDKDFAEQLCKDLEACNYFPFFDKRPHSLPKGQEFPSRIFKAASECFLAIVLLSQEFLTAVSKWPMLELTAFAHALKASQHVKVLPVLLGRLQPRDLKDTARWSKHWRKWAKRDTRIDCSEWKAAVRALEAVNMLVQSKFDGEVALRSEIVSTVLSLIPPDVRPDVSHVQGKEYLYKEIMERFSDIRSGKSLLCKNARIVGVYGIVGVGKSTMCMVLAHLLNREFRGRACHLVFGSGNITLQLQLALRQLTGASHDFVQRHINNAAEGWTCLKERIPRQRVFLALDNESDKPETWEVAKNFLYGLEYRVNSMVFVTSRSKDVLEKVLGIPESCCMHCPCVTTEDAVKIVLDHNGLENIEALTKEQRHILHRAVEMCNFGGFHPMALKVLATQLGRNPFSWRLSSLSLSEASDREHMLFAQMETIFLRLSDEMRDMFMDVALFTPEVVESVYELCLWLMNTLHSGCGSLDELREKLDALRLKSLLEVWSLESDKVCMHDLHRELAIRRARLGDGSGSRAVRFVHQTCGKFDLSMIEQAERACFIGASCTKLAFDGCSKKLMLLSARSCLNLVELELRGLTRLVSLELSACAMETLDLKDLMHLSWLCLTSCKSLTKLDTSGCKALVCVYISRCDELEALDFKNSNLLESVSLSYNDYLQVVDLGSGNCLHRLVVWFCEALREVAMSEFICLHEFKKRGCPMLLNLHGCQKLSQNVSCFIVTRWHKISEELITALQASIYLTVLDLWDCPVSRLPDLRNCSGLRELKLSDVDVFLDSDNKALQHEYADILCASSDELALPESLQEITIGDCRNTVVKEVCWKLRGLRNVLVLSLQRVRVSWDWELYRSSTKAFSPSLCLDNTQCDLVSLRDQLHKKIGMQPDEASDATQKCSDDEWDEETSDAEQSCDDEWDEEMSTSNAEIAGEVISVQQTAESSVKMPSEVSSFEQIGHDRAAFASHRCEKPSTFIKILSNVIYWIREFLRDEGMQSQVKDIITNSWQKQPVESPLEEYQDLGESWGRLFICDEMREVHYKSPDYVLLEAFDNFDSLWEFYVETVNGRVFKCEEVLPRLRHRTVYQLRQQLSVLHALSRSGQNSFSCKPWQQKAMDEIFFFEYMITASLAKADKEVMCEKLAGDGCMFSPWRYKKLEKTVHLMTCRLLQQDTELWKHSSGYSGQWQQDWLKSCKVCMAMQVLCVILNQEDLQVVSLHRRWFSDMMQEVDCLFQRKMLTTRAGAGMEDLRRAWTARQWLQKLGLSLSRKWVEEDIREIVASTPEGELGLQAWFGGEELGSTKLQAKPTLIVDVVGLQGKLKQALQMLQIELSDAEWEANDIWLNKYRIIENVMRREGNKWRCRSLHPSNNWKEAALHDLCNRTQAFSREGHATFYVSANVRELLEAARLQKRVHDMVIRLQLNPSVNNVDQRYKCFVQESLRLPYSSFDLVEGLRNAGIGGLSQVPLNLLVTTCLEVQMASRLKSALEPLKELRSLDLGMGVFELDNAVISSQIDDNLKLTLPMGLQTWAKAEGFPLRTTWQAINNGKPFVLPIRSKLRYARITSESLVIPSEYRSHE